MGNTFPAYWHLEKEVPDALERLITHGPQDPVYRRLSETDAPCF
jgi:hypothetical protein